MPGSTQETQLFCDCILDTFIQHVPESKRDMPRPKLFWDLGFSNEPDLVSHVQTLNSLH